MSRIVYRASGFALPTRPMCEIGPEKGADGGMAKE